MPYTSVGRQIVLLGAGRVAQHLGPALWRAGHTVTHVWSRTPASAQQVATQIPGALPITSLDLQAVPAAELYILCVPDGAVPAVLAEAVFPAAALVVHTAGALPLAVFAPYAGLRGGVLYPLQTFSPGRLIDWPAVPFCVEAATPADEALVAAVARSLSQVVELVATPQRQQIHVAAVFACNFTNHLLGIGHALLQEAGLPFTLLEPLIRETVQKALAQPPFTVQTGPAVRHDAATLDRHRALLLGHPQWQQIYNQLTASIQAT
ncbi:Rossmann-like and DUF2520 domain-containing protein [Hymenobacter chitinivorans]|uniref:Putative short-subunit dehydrogenase-like oxidoreductase (DUF2520 family) n=1 Tax=Hymenobacter chitinivorans DSM 11115 TaxID=1121954 RepID=A0A2M9AQ41_9BACT|nr:Rossmann-like and DUF2520 domain-containing protein [Hymenobacter chitinivorans]PJJ47816.1 putative short-subunit dehydrogenase-like oxidoreductase (DUF2520 family) [Hymenobacter chitinivorans DSM 11115]